MSLHRDAPSRPAPSLRSHAERLIVLTLTAPQAEIRPVRELVASLIPPMGWSVSFRAATWPWRTTGTSCGLSYASPPWYGPPAPARPRVHPELH